MNFYPSVVQQSTALVEQQVPSIIKLAMLRRGVSDEFSANTDVTDPELQEMIDEELTSKRRMAKREAAMAIVALQTDANSTKSHLVEQIRRARAFIDDAKERLTEIDLATEYGNATLNFVPLLNKVAEPLYRKSPIAVTDISKIPNNWKTTVATAAEKKTTTKKAAKPE